MTWAIADPPMPKVDDLLPKNEKKLPTRSKLDVASLSVNASRNPRSFKNKYMMPVTLISSIFVAASTATFCSSFCTCWFNWAPSRTMAADVFVYWV